MPRNALGRGLSALIREPRRRSRSTSRRSRSSSRGQRSIRPNPSRRHKRRSSQPVEPTQPSTVEPVQQQHDGSGDGGGSGAE